MSKNKFILRLFFSISGTVLIFSMFLGSGISLSNFSTTIERDSIKQKFEFFHTLWPAEKLAILNDKPLYDPGETLWFSVLLANGQTLKRTGLSEIVYVELINPKGSIEKKFSLIAKGGKANGDYQIPVDAIGGIYKIKGYTRWMQQMGKEAIKEIQIQEVVLPNLKLTLELDRKAYKAGDLVTVNFSAENLDNAPLINSNFQYSIFAGDQNLLNQNTQTDGNGKKTFSFLLPKIPAGSSPVINIRMEYGEQSESISKSIPLADKELLVYFFPEGGDFIKGISSKIAFKVLKADSTSADAEGWLMTKKGQRIQYIKTKHDGMGFFDLEAKEGEQYHIEWTSPISFTSNLPEALDKGYSLSVQSFESELLIKTNSPTNDPILLVAQMRGKWLWDKTLKGSSGGSTTKVNIKNWPAGVVRFTVFDSRKLPRCERSVFVNAQKKLQVRISTDKEKYQTREKVNVNVRVADEKGIPVPGLLNLSVVNDVLLNYTADKQGNLVSGLLLEQELNAKLDNPGFYFSDNLNAKNHLDLVMLTFGWTGFEWRKIMDETIEKPSEGPERAIIAGTVIYSNDNKPLKKGKLEIGSTVIYTDSNGRFRFPFIDLTKPATIKISKGNEKTDVQTITQYGSEMILYYNPYPPVFMKMEMADGKMIPMAAMAGGMGDKKIEGDVRLRKKGLQPNIKAKNAVANDNAQADNALKKERNNEGAPALNKRRAFPIIQPPAQDPISPYYLARKFPNLPPTKTALRTDFKTTLFWTGLVDLDANGRGNYSFYTGDDITSYKITAQSAGPDGLLGVAEKLFYTELPFSISSKIPVELTIGDKITFPITVSNKTNKVLSLNLLATLGKGFKLVKSIPESISIQPSEKKELPLEAIAFEKTDSSKLQLSASLGEEKDIWEKSIRIVPRGYPVNLSFSGKEMNNAYIADIKNMIPGSLTAEAMAFPDVTSDLLTGVESILSEPFGCFEQTSMTSYPNVLVLNYLREAKVSNPALVSNAEVLLEKGYKRLTSFETKQKGYEWFGGTPAHEALTAYGLLQFKEIQKVSGYVDQSMVDRTANWLLSRRDGKGGFLKSAQALDNFGRANDDITNAYIVYSLAEAGFQQLDLEVKKTTEIALLKKDPYLLALAANTLWLLKQNEKAIEVTAALLQTQAENGSWTGLTHSITYSQGNALSVETTGFAILALIRSSEPNKLKIDKGVEFLIKQRSGNGGFGNSQATIVALKALTSYVVFSKRAAEDGAFTLSVNGKETAKADWKAGTQNTIIAKGWEGEIKEGQNKLEFGYSILKEPLPFTISLDYFTSMPKSDPACKIKIETKISSPTVKLGEVVQMTVKLTNTSTEGQPMTMASVNIPGGCVVSPVQLRDLQQSKLVDFYEIKGNRIFLYYRQMVPSEVKNITLTLNPIFKGKFEASASSAYLYYTAERKDWAKGLGLEIE